METMAPELIDSERPLSQATASISDHSDVTARLLHSHTLPLHQPHHALHSPLPYLDVLSIQSRRLVAQTQAEIDHHEAQTLGSDSECPANDDNELESQRRLETLLESVRLLIEPIEIPDMSHTGVFHNSISQLQPAVSEKMRRGAAANTRLTLSTINNEHDVTLFYPTGAKKINMREYVHEVIERHLASESTQSRSDNVSAAHALVVGNRQEVLHSPTKRLGVSASEPVLAAHPHALSSIPVTSAPIGMSGAMSSSVKKPRTKTSASPLKHKNAKALAGVTSPTTAKSSKCSSPLLNRELTRQAKDIIAAVRANSSKINELMST